MDRDMTLQLGLALLLVAAATSYLGWTWWKSWRKFGSGGCCGKARTGPDTNVTFVPSESLELKRDRRPDNGRLSSSQSLEGESGEAPARP